MIGRGMGVLDGGLWIAEGIFEGDGVAIMILFQSGEDLMLSVARAKVVRRDGEGRVAEIGLVCGGHASKKVDRAAIEAVAREPGGDRLSKAARGFLESPGDPPGGHAFLAEDMPSFISYVNRILGDSCGWTSFNPNLG